MSARPTTGARTLLLLWDWIPSRVALGGVAALSLLAGLLEAVIVGLVAGLGAAVAQGRDVMELAVGPVALSATVGESLLVGFGGVLAMVAARLVASVIASRVVGRTLVGARTRLLDTYLSTSYEVQRTLVQAELHDLVTFQAMRLSQAVLTVTRAMSAALTFLALVAVAFLFDPLTAGLMLVVSLGLAVVFLPLVRRSNRAGQSHLDAQIAVGMELGDVTGLLAEIHAYGAHRGMLQRLSGSVDEAGRAFQVAAFILQITPTLYLATVLGLLLGALATLNAVGVADLQTVGAIALLMLRGLKYSQQVQSQFQVAVEHAPDIASVTAATKRFVAGRTSDVGDEVPAVDEMELRGVTYHHPGTTEGIEDVDVVLRRGEVVGVVGHSGAGKSTLAELVLGLREPTQGTVWVNGRPRNEYRRSSWFARVAYVGQESRLLAGTVASNVAFFRAVEPAQIARVLKAASLTDDLERWSAGAEREVGSGGRDVSGGQRQRIAIARALVGEPDVVVLDEPTSALDPESERRIRETIAALAGEVLVIVVAHRHSTLAVCDRILSFEGGRCTEVTVESLGDLPLDHV